MVSSAAYSQHRVLTASQRSRRAPSADPPGAYRQRATSVGLPQGEVQLAAEDIEDPPESDALEQSEDFLADEHESPALRQAPQGRRTDDLG